MPLADVDALSDEAPDDEGEQQSEVEEVEEPASKPKKKSKATPKKSPPSTTSKKSKAMKKIKKAAAKGAKKKKSMQKSEPDVADDDEDQDEDGNGPTEAEDLGSPDEKPESDVLVVPQQKKKPKAKAKSKSKAKAKAKASTKAKAKAKGKACMRRPSAAAGPRKVSRYTYNADRKVGVKVDGYEWVTACNSEAAMKECENMDSTKEDIKTLVAEMTDAKLREMKQNKAAAEPPAALADKEDNDSDDNENNESESGEQASPPGRDGQFWLAGTDLPPLSADHGISLHQKCSGGSRTSQNTATERPTSSCALATSPPTYWNDFTDALSQIWSGLRVSQIFEVFKYPDDGKARYGVLIQRHNDQEFDVLRARAIHGHWSGLLSDQTDLADTRRAVHSFVEWDASLATRPKIQPNDMYSDEFVNFPFKLGYHGAYVRHFPDIAEWQRTDNAGLREKADVEFVIDLQMAVRDGLRIFETRSGALETPDWVSNKYFVYIYQRGTSEPLWVNPVHQAISPKD
eukprot:s1383_g8.t1